MITVPWKPGRTGIVVSFSPHRWVIWVRCPVPAIRNDSVDHCTQVTIEHRWRWIKPGFETHGQSHPKLGVPVAQQNGLWSNKNLFEKLFHETSVVTRGLATPSEKRTRKRHSFIGLLFNPVYLPHQANAKLTKSENNTAKQNLKCLWSYTMVGGASIFLQIQLQYLASSLPPCLALIVT